MLKRSHTVASGVMLLFLLIAVPPVWPQRAESLRQIAGTIALGPDSPGRRLAITARLETAGIEFQLEDFVDRRMRKGTNIIASIPGKTPRTILLGAHYDRVAQGQGVLDNAMACVALVDLLETVKAKPLKNLTLRVVFFDLEEGGLGGSQAYFEAIRGQVQPAFAVNLDIFGYGDAIFATASKSDGPLLAALQRAGSESGYPVKLAPAAEYPSSDHRNMIAAGIETLGLSLLDAAETDAVIDLLSKRSAALPPVLTTIHTARDTLAAVRIEEVEKAIPLVERMIRLLDERE